MSGLFGAQKSFSHVEPAAAGLRVQTSAYGGVIPIVFGRTRIAGNLIWYGDFVATAHTDGAGGGKGGGSAPGYTTYTYKTAFALGLCEGPITSINGAWSDKDKMANAVTSGLKKEKVTATETFTLTAVPMALPALAHAADFVKLVKITKPDEFPGNQLALWPSVDYTCTAGSAITILTGVVGEVVTVNYAWEKDVTISPIFSHKKGTYPQSAWTYLTSKHPTEALGYEGLAYVAASAYDLGDVPYLPNHSFDITGFAPYSVADGIHDAAPQDIIVGLLTNANWGAGFPVGKIGDLSAMHAFTVASGFFLSPALLEQTPTAEIIGRLCDLVQCAPFYSEDRLKIVPLTDTAVSGNGFTYTPPAAALYDLTDDDFICDSGEDPVRIQRASNADAFNHIQIECLNKGKQYNQEVAEAKDQAAIDTFGLRTKDTIKAHEITSPAVARRIAQHMVQRAVYIRNIYEFRLGWSYCLLEPADIVTLTDETLGMDKWPVRIVSIEEDDMGTLTMRAEDYPAGVHDATIYPNESGVGYDIDYNAPAGDITIPAFVESPTYKVTTGLAIGAAVSGVDDNWGGCDVWVSYDGDSYNLAGRINGGSRYGYTDRAISSAAGQVLKVSLIGHGGTLSSGSIAAAAKFATLCQIGGELVAYTTATLTGENEYSLTLAQRGVDRTSPASHVAGEPFMRLDNSIVWSDPLPVDRIGTEIFFKFCSFNIYGGGRQNLEDVSAYAYTITGKLIKVPLAAPTGFVVDGNKGGRWSMHWNNVDEVYVTRYEVRLVNANWGDDDEYRIFFGTATSCTFKPEILGNYTFYVSATDKYGNRSAVATISKTYNPPGTVPAPTQDVAKVASGKATVVLDWADTAVVGSFPLGGYEIRTTNADWGSVGYRYRGLASTASLANVSTTATTTWYLCAFDINGNYSAVSRVVVHDAVVPGNVGVLTISRKGADLQLFASSYTKPSDFANFEFRIGKYRGGATAGDDTPDAVVGTGDIWDDPDCVVVTNTNPMAQVALSQFPTPRYSATGVVYRAAVRMIDRSGNQSAVSALANITVKSLV